MKRFSVWFLALVALLSIRPAAAQWTVYDPSNYYENLENYYQLYNANAQLVQQYQQQVQQYQMFANQFTQTPSLSTLQTYAQNTSQMHSNGIGMQIANGSGNSSQFWNNSAYEQFMTALGGASDGNSNRAIGASAASLNLPSSITNANGSLAQTPVAYNNYLINYGLAANGLTSVGAASANVRQRNQTLGQLENSVYSDSDQSETAIAQKGVMASAILARAQNDTADLLSADVALSSERANIDNNALAEKLQNSSDIQTSYTTVDSTWTGSNAALGTGYNNLSGVISGQVQ